MSIIAHRSSDIKIASGKSDYRQSLDSDRAPRPPKIGPGTRRPVPTPPEGEAISGPPVVDEARRHDYEHVLALSNQHLSDDPPIPALLTEVQAVFWRDWSLERLWQLEMLAMAQSSPKQPRRQRDRSPSHS